MHLRLFKYTFQLKYIPEKENMFADAVSCNKNNKIKSDTSFMEYEIYALTSPLVISEPHTNQLKEETIIKDPVLRKIIKQYSTDWENFTTNCDDL